MENNYIPKREKIVIPGYSEELFKIVKDSMHQKLADATSTREVKQILVQNDIPVPPPTQLQDIANAETKYEVKSALS